MSRLALVCRDSGRRFDPRDPIWRSPAGGLLDIEFDAAFPIDAIRARPATMWRYREALPILDDAAITSLGEPITPLIELSWAGRRVVLKLDSLMPSGTYKDRGAAMLLTHLRAIGVRQVVEDSSGNAGAAIAMYAAAAGIACEIIVPESASPAKLVQARSAGARVRAVPGPRQAAADAAWLAAQSVYYASHSWNPWFFQGTKTFAYELVEQLGWRAPDAVVIPTGNGTLLLGAAIGFEDLRRAGVIDRVPRLIAVQSSACAPLARAMSRSAASPIEDPADIGADSIAEGVAIPSPIRGEQCLDAVRRTGGRVIAIDDDAVRRALREALARGLFIEPTSALSLAAVDEIRDIPGEVVLAITGHGLKAAGSIAKVLDSGHAGGGA